MNETNNNLRLGDGSNDSIEKSTNANNKAKSEDPLAPLMGIMEESYRRGMERARQEQIAYERSLAIQEYKADVARKKAIREAKEARRKKRRNKRIATAALTCLVGYGVVSLGINVGKEVIDKLDFSRDLSSAQDYLCSQLESKLESDGVDLDNLDVNTIDPSISELELYTYYCLFDDQTCDEVAQVIDPLPNDRDQISGYGNGLYNVYSRLGYLDGQGRPSTEVWLNHMEAKAVEGYRNGNLSLNSKTEGRNK